MSLDFGLKIGEVVRPDANNAEAKNKDPNCIQVKIPYGINSSSKQPVYKIVDARVLASFAGVDTGTKKSYGSVIIPQTGEQVLVGYLDGHDEGEAYVLGSVYQGSVKPPYDISKDMAAGDTKAGESMVIKLKNETQISINNVSATDTSIVITTGGNNRIIKLTDKKGSESSLQISDNEKNPQTYLKMDFQNGAIECKASKKMTLAAGQGDKGSIIIDGETGNITIKGQGKVSIDSTQGSALSCGSTGAVNITQQGTEVKGTKVDIKGTSVVNVGTMVKLG